MVKEIEMNPDEAVAYIKDNVVIGDGLDLSYNRVFVPGEVLNLDTSAYFGKDGLKVMINVDEENTSTATEVDLVEVKDDLVEVVHRPQDSGDELIIIVV